MQSRTPSRSGERIIRDPRVCGGEPTIEGTRVPVSSIVVQWRFHQNLSRVHEAFPHVEVPTIKKALRYYEEHRQEIDGLIEEHERAANAPD